MRKAFAADGEGAGVGLVRAGDNFDQRALARAVFAEQRVDFAGLQGEIDPAQGPGAAERFGDGAEFEERGGGHGLRGENGDGGGAKRASQITLPADSPSPAVPRGGR